MVNQHWVLLSYRVPREPSTPRIAVWRRLKQLGVLQIGDGLVALPVTDESQEQLEWVAETVTQANGEATVWQATPTTRGDSDTMVQRLRDERSVEYSALLQEITTGAAHDARSTTRWRREFRRITRRDHFDAPGREEVKAAISQLVPASDIATVEQ